MYIPAAFAENDPRTLRDFIAAHGFATLITHGDDGPFASHLPLLFEDSPNDSGRLIGHMARANPQWRSAAGGRALTVFHGPHAYISPTWYETPNTVPTWNYLAVHVTGPFRLIEDRSSLLAIVRRMVTIYEAAQPQPWSLDSVDPAVLERLLEAIVGFEIPVERIEGKWKLNQNYDAARRARVADALERSPDENGRLTAEWMRRKA